MTCPTCAKLQDETNPTLPHVVKICGDCGGEYRFREPGKHGIGFKIEKGDRVVIPAGFLKLSANPLKGSGRMSRHGIEWFAELVFGVDLANKKSRENITDALEKIQESNEKFFKDADYLKDLDLNNLDDQKLLFDRIQEREKSIEWWGFMASLFSSLTIDSVKAGDAATAAWAAATAERHRAMAIFKENFEEVVFMGNSAGRLIDLIHLWDANRDNDDEGFWQIKLTEHSYAFSQLFSVPVTFIEGRAYVGGTQLDGRDARYLDFMLAGGSANHAILVEIKTPKSKLLGQRYRGNAYSPSRELGSAIVQVNDYCDTLRKNVTQITKDRNLELNTFNPRRIILIGNYENELRDQKMRSSFELFRGSLSGIEIVTFDEFFKKAEQMAKLFNLTRKTSAPTT